MDTHHVIEESEENEFSVSGMDDEVRENYKETHPVGTVITIEYSGKTASGKPRSARYMRIRDDVIIKDKDDIPKSTVKRDLIIQIFKKLGDYERSNGQAFKASSYMKAISGLKAFSDDSDLTESNIFAIKGVGKSLSEKALCIMKSGTCPAFEKIKDQKNPKEILMGVHGVGPKKAAELLKMGIHSIEDLRNFKDIEEQLTDAQIIGVNYYEDLNERIPRKEIEKHEVLF